MASKLGHLQIMLATAPSKAKHMNAMTTPTFPPTTMPK